MRSRRQRGGIDERENPDCPLTAAAMRPIKDETTGWGDLEMNHLKAVLLLFVCHMVSLRSVHAQVQLTLGKGPTLPGDASLMWTGDIPNFDVFRGPGPAGVTSPANTLTITGGRQTVDGQVPAPGTGFYYMVTSLGPCDPLNPTAICGSGAHCYPTEDGLTNCSGPVGAATHCSACSSNASCAPIDVCVNGTQCSQWCRTGGFSDCPPPFSCFAILPLLYVGTQAYGICSCF